MEPIENTLKNAFVDIMKPMLIDSNIEIDYRSGFDENSFNILSQKKINLYMVYTESCKGKKFTLEIFNNGEMEKHFTFLPEDFSDRPILIIENNILDKNINITILFGNLLYNNSYFLTKKELLEQGINIDSLLYKINQLRVKLKKDIYQQ